MCGGSIPSALAFKFFTMNNLIERLTSEQLQLNQKIDKLKVYLEVSPDISTKHLQLLKVQLNAMEIYNHILIERISDLTADVA